MNPSTIPSEASAEQLRVKAADLLDATQHYDARILITRSGKPAGRLIPPGMCVPTDLELEAVQAAFDTVRDAPTYMNLPDDARAAIDMLGDLLDTLHGNPKEAS
jgi:prevent-host-death family protein